MSKYDSCGYCGGNMTLVAIRIKRRVPQGAKDLGIYDEGVAWKCEKCENTVRNHGITQCENCGKWAVDSSYSDSAPGFPVITSENRSSPYYERHHNWCSNCTPPPICPNCGRPNSEHAYHTKTGQFPLLFHIECPKLVSERKSCFIATAVYGCNDAPEVIFLRAFRDQVLTRNVLGKWTIDVYYKISPPIARFIENTPLAKNVVRGIVLNPIIRFISRRFPSK